MADVDEWARGEDWPRVISWCETGLKADPFAVEPLRHYVRASYEVGCYDDARGAVGRLAAPGAAEFAIDALCQAFTGRPEAALRRLAEWDDAPTADIAAAAGLILLATAQLDAASVAFAEAIALDPADASAHHGLAWILEATTRGADRAAVYAHIDAACASSPNPQYQQTRGVALLNDGRAEQALAEFRAALQKWQSRQHTRKEVFLAEAHGNIACALCRLGRLEEAVDAVQDALAALPTHLRPSARRRFRQDDDLAPIVNRRDFRRLMVNHAEEMTEEDLDAILDPPGRAPQPTLHWLEQAADALLELCGAMDDGVSVPPATMDTIEQFVESLLVDPSPLEQVFDVEAPDDLPHEVFGLLDMMLYSEPQFAEFALQFVTQKMTSLFDPVNDSASGDLLEALGEVSPGPELAALLVAIATDRGRLAAVRAGAVRGLASCLNAQVEAALLPLMDDDTLEGWARVAVLDTLRASVVREHGAHALLTDLDPVVRTATARLVSPADWHDPSVREQLVALAQQGSDGESYAAWSTIQRLADVGFVPAAIEVACGPQQGAARWGLRWLQGHDLEPEQIGRVVAAPNEAIGREWFGLAWSLVRSQLHCAHRAAEPPDWPVDLLDPELMRPGLGAQLPIAHAVGLMGTLGWRSRHAIIRELGGMPSPHLTGAVALALGMLGDVADLRFIEAMLTHADSDVRHQAALGHLALTRGADAAVLDRIGTGRSESLLFVLTLLAPDHPPTIAPFVQDRCDELLRRASRYQGVEWEILARNARRVLSSWGLAPTR